MKANPLRSPQRRALHLAIFAALASVPCAGRAADETWIASTSALWSLDAAWLDGSAPSIGGGPDLVLRFLNDGADTFTATNNLGAPFFLNRLVLDNDATGAITIRSAAGSSLQFAGAAPLIQFSGRGTSEVASELFLNASDGSTTISGTGVGTLRFSAPIREQSPGQVLTINAPAPSQESHFVVLAGVNSFSGGLILNAGNLQLEAFTTPLGTGPVTINGGTLRAPNSSAVNVPNAVSLNTDLRITEGGAFAIGGVISSSVPGTGLIYQNSGSSSFRALILTNASTYDGLTILDFSPIASAALSAGSELRLSGAGSILNTSAVHVRAGAALRLESTGGANNRIGDTTPVHLRGGELLLVAPTAAAGPQTETIGALTAAGHATVTAQPDTDAGVVVTASSLARVERGTLLFRGVGLGNAPGVNVGNVFFSTLPQLSGGDGTGPETSILPYAIGGNSNTDNGGGLVTYDASTGIRPLNTATEYTASLGAAAPTHNVRLTASETNDSSRTVNALVFAASSGSLSGAGTLTLGSGTLVNLGTFTIANGLAFGAREGIVFTQGSLTVSGVISGTGGLTKSSADTLTLAAANTFTGPLTINAGTLSFSSAQNLGPETSPIVINAPGRVFIGGTGANLLYTGSTDLALTRPIELGTGIAGIGGIGTGRLQLDAPVNGVGGLTLTGRVRLGTSNTYSGPTVLNGDTIIAADSAFGIGGGVDFSNGTLTLAGDWISARPISVSGSGTLDTGGFSAEINGVFSGAGELRKRGAGTVRLAAEALYSGALTVEGGTFELRQNGSLFSTGLSARTGGELRLENSAVVNNDRVADNAVLTLAGGRLTLIGHGSSLVDERIGSVATGEIGGGVVTLSAPGSARTLLTIGTFSNTRGDVLFRGDQLGDRSRVIFATPPAAVDGIVPGLFASPVSGGAATTFAVYDSSLSGGATIGVRGLTAAERTPASVIQNPASGGTTPANAHVEIDSAATAIGSSNSVASLLLGTNGSLTLGGAQQLRISSGGVLIREDAIAPVLAGGTLDFGAQPGVIYLGATTTISSAITGLSDVRKTGPGTLRLEGPVLASGGFSISHGAVQPVGVPFAARLLNISSGGTLDLADAPTTVGGLAGGGAIVLGSQTLTVGSVPNSSSFFGTISGTGRLEIVSGGNSRALRSFFGGSSTFSGGTVLQSGRLYSQFATSLGTGPLTVNGGSLFAATTGTFGVPLQLQTDLLTEGSVTITFATAAVTSGAYAVELRGRGSIVVQAPWSHTGETRTGFAMAEPPSAAAGSITLSGRNGALVSTSGIRIGPGSALLLNNVNANPAGGAGRIGDATPVMLRSASFELRGNIGLSTIERIGVLEARGDSTITVTPGTLAATTLQVASLQRGERSTVLFRAPANGLGTILFDAPLTGLVGGSNSGPATRILPYAIGDVSATGTGSGLVTYDTTGGVRILNAATDYAASLAAAGANDNVRLTASAVNDAVKQVNALVLEGAVNVSGMGTLQPGSGVLLKTGSAATETAISNAIEFGAVEGRVFVTGTTGGLTLNGPVRGSAGLTKAGPRALTLNAANPFTGPLTINAGDVIFRALENLGGDTGAIVFNGGMSGSGLSYNGASPLAFPRNIGDCSTGIDNEREKLASRGNEMPTL